MIKKYFWSVHYKGKCKRIQHQIIVKHEEGQTITVIVDSNGIQQAYLRYGIAYKEMKISYLYVEPECRLQGMATDLLIYILKSNPSIKNVWLSPSPSGDAIVAGMTPEKLERFYQNFSFGFFFNLKKINKLYCNTSN